MKYFEYLKNTNMKVPNDIRSLIIKSYVNGTQLSKFLLYATLNILPYTLLLTYTKKKTGSKQN